MKIEQSFTVGRPADEVWRFFHDVRAVAECMPGATLTEDKGGGAYAGKVAIKLGPFSAAFEGEANVEFRDESRSGQVTGKGVDKRGGSRSKLDLDFALAEVPEGTKVALDADIQLSGAIAQFGRTGLITETSTILMKEFAANLEDRLQADAATAEPAPPSGAASGGGAAAAPRPAERPKRREISGTSLAWRGLVAWIKSFFRKA